MREITPASAAAYLVEHDRVAATGSIQCHELAWGVSNVVIEIVHDDGAFVLKQSRPKLRTDVAWYSDVSRIYREIDVLRILHHVLPTGTVPEIIFEDRPNYLFAMSRINPAHFVWKKLLLDRQTDRWIAQRAGNLLGMVHAKTLNDQSIRNLTLDNTNFIELRVEPFYSRLATSHPVLAERIDSIIANMLSHPSCLTLADFSPKNILVHDRQVSLVDFETAHWGHPAFDVGFFLTHLVLKSIHFPDLAQSFHDMIDVFWSSYCDGSPFDHESLVVSASDHLALCMLTRVDGTSPVDYLDDHQKDVARALAFRLLNEPVQSWNQLWTHT